MDDIMTLLPEVRLHFNIKHPTMEEAYWYGYECAHADIQEEDNPFAAGTTESDSWMEGWWAGFYNEEPLFACPMTFDNGAVESDHSANDHLYHEHIDNFFIKFLEISGVLVISAMVGYQLIELVA